MPSSSCLWFTYSSHQHNTNSEFIALSTGILWDGIASCRASDSSYCYTFLCGEVRPSSVTFMDCAEISGQIQMPFSRVHLQGPVAHYGRCWSLTLQGNKRFEVKPIAKTCNCLFMVHQVSGPIFLYSSFFSTTQSSTNISLLHITYRPQPKQSTDMFHDLLCKFPTKCIPQNFNTLQIN